jgi:hypothetical protein
MITTGKHVMTKYSMNNMSKKIFAVMLSLCLLTIGMPLQGTKAFASEVSGNTATVQSTQAATTSDQTSDQSKSTSINGTIQATLDLENASITVDGQTYGVD